MTISEEIYNFIAGRREVSSTLYPVSVKTSDNLIADFLVNKEKEEILGFFNSPYGHTATITPNEITIYTRSMYLSQLRSMHIHIITEGDAINPKSVFYLLGNTYEFSKEYIKTTGTYLGECLGDPVSIEIIGDKFVVESDVEKLRLNPSKSKAVREMMEEIRSLLSGYLILEQIPLEDIRKYVSSNVKGRYYSAWNADTAIGMLFNNHKEAFIKADTKNKAVILLSMFVSNYDLEIDEKERLDSKLTRAAKEMIHLIDAFNKRRVIHKKIYKELDCYEKV